MMKTIQDFKSQLSNKIEILEQSKAEMKMELKKWLDPHYPPPQPLFLVYLHSFVTFY